MYRLTKCMNWLSERSLANVLWKGRDSPWKGSSVAQICEAFLLAGSDAYKKQGGKFAKRALAQLITKSSAD